MQEASKALAAEGDLDKEFGGVLKKQKRRSDVAEDLGTNGDPKEAPEKTQELLDAYFGKDDQLAEDERFLKHYMLNKVDPLTSSLMATLLSVTFLFTHKFSVVTLRSGQ